MLWLRQNILKHFESIAARSTFPVIRLKSMASERLRCKPERMPSYFFRDAVRLDYSSTIAANVSRQNYTVNARDWYIDAYFSCVSCDAVFCFSAKEQEHWYESLGFYVDSCANRCPECRKQKRHQMELRKEYDENIESALTERGIELKRRIANVIDQLSEPDVDIPPRMLENRRIIAKQIEEISRVHNG